MSKVRLIDIDSKIPNLALMKVAGYYQDVDWYNPFFDIDKDLKIPYTNIIAFLLALLIAV